MRQSLLWVSRAELDAAGSFEVIAILGKGADQAVEQRDGFREFFQCGGIRGQTRRSNTGVLTDQDGFSASAQALAEFVVDLIAR